jgi:hypothetical protein
MWDDENIGCVYLIISQWTHIAKHHAGHLKHIIFISQLDLNKPGNGKIFFVTIFRKYNPLY